MRINALLDVDVVAHESEDEVAVLLELEAPAAEAAATRPPATLEVVLDRSGSMHGPPLEGAKEALIALVRRLEPTDHFGLVAFDDRAQVVVPAGPLTDKHAVIDRIRAVDSGGTTDLSAGYLRALREVRRVAGDAGATVLVISDGHVNAGIRDADEIAGIAAKAYADRVVTSTLGYGTGYDETMLAAIARTGSGNHVFGADPDAAGAAIAEEVDGLLEKVVQAVSLTIAVEPAVELVQLYNDLPAEQIGAGTVMVELGDLYGAEARKVLLKLRVPALAQLGVARVATLTLSYVALATLTEETVTLPITVNVVPGDEAAGRVADPTVRSEVVFQEAQATKKQASEAFERGDLAGAKAMLEQSRATLTDGFDGAPLSMVAEFHAELDEIQTMAELAEQRDASYLSKLSRASYHRGTKKRGRGTRPDEAGE